MKYLIMLFTLFSSGMVMTLMTHMLTGIFLNLLLANPLAYASPVEQCSINCLEPTVIDPNLGIDVVASGLNAPSNMVFVNDNEILVLERYSGIIKRIINDTLEQEPLLDLNIASGAGERGLLGIALSKTTEHSYIFIYFTESEFDGGTPIGNRLYKYELLNGNLSNKNLLLDLPYSPGPYHNGGGLTIGPDNNIYLTVGDLDNVDDKVRPNATTQNVEGGVEPNGSGGILRITQNGDEVGRGILGNTYPLSLYYAYGIRNSFGIDFDPVTLKLWDTENGPNYGDEINLVEPGFNSGWKEVQGVWKLKGSNMGKELDNKPEGLVDFNGRGKYSTPEFTWKERYGPTAIKFLVSDKLGIQYENDAFVGDIHNGTLYHFEMNETRTGFSLEGLLGDRIANSTSELRQVIFGTGFGGITDLEVGNDGYLYVLSYVNESVYRIHPVKK
jgi:glucose/arabinose dehydrogenase